MDILNYWPHAHGLILRSTLEEIKHFIGPGSTPKWHCFIISVYTHIFALADSKSKLRLKSDLRSHQLVGIKNHLYCNDGTRCLWYDI